MIKTICLLIVIILLSTVVGATFSVPSFFAEEILHSMNKALEWLEGYMDGLSDTSFDKYMVMYDILYFLKPPLLSKGTEEILLWILNYMEKQNTLSIDCLRHVEYIMEEYDLVDLDPELYELSLKGVYLTIRDIYKAGFENIDEDRFYEAGMDYVLLGYVKARQVEKHFGLRPHFSRLFEDIFKKRLSFMMENGGSWYPADEYGGYAGRNAWTLMRFSDMGMTKEDLPDLGRTVDFLLEMQDEEHSCWGVPKKKVPEPKRNGGSACVYMVDGLGEVLYTACAVSGLLENGISPIDSRIENAVYFLLKRQKDDGRWRAIYEPNWPNVFKDYFWYSDSFTTILVLKALKKYFDAGGIDIADLSEKENEGVVLKYFKPALDEEGFRKVLKEKFNVLKRKFEKKFGMFLNEFEKFE